MPAGKPKKRTKDQHYVPRLHLQHFCGESPKNMIWTYSKSRGTARPSRIEETGFQKNYYSMKDDEGNFRDEIESLLADIEAKASAPYLRLLAGEIPTGQDRADFAVFLASCYSRSPAIIRSFAEGYARMAHLQLRLNTSTRTQFDNLMDRMERDTGEKVEDRDEVFSLINDPTRYSIGISEKRGLKAIELADSLAPLLFQRIWHVVESVAGRFITSDNPICRWVPPDSIHPIYGDGGFKNGRAEISFPLSSTRMLVMSGKQLGEGVLYAGSATVAGLNRMRAAEAEEFLYADCKDERITAFASEFKEKRSRMIIGMEEAQEVEVNVTR